MFLGSPLAPAVPAPDWDGTVSQHLRIDGATERPDFVFDQFASDFNDVNGGLTIYIDMNHDSGAGVARIPYHLRRTGASLKASLNYSYINPSNSRVSIAARGADAVWDYYDIDNYLGNINVRIRHAYVFDASGFRLFWNGSLKLNQSVTWGSDYDLNEFAMLCSRGDSGYLDASVVSFGWAIGHAATAGELGALDDPRQNIPFDHFYSTSNIYYDESGGVWLYDVGTANGTPARTDVEMLGCTSSNIIAGAP